MVENVVGSWGAVVENSSWGLLVSTQGLDPDKQRVRKEFSVAFEQLVYRALVWSSVDFIERAAVSAFLSGFKTEH